MATLATTRAGNGDLLRQILVVVATVVTLIVNGLARWLVWRVNREARS